MMKKYMKIKLNLDNLPLKNTLKLYNMVLVVWSVFHEGQGNKYYPSVFFDEFLYTLYIFI